MRIGIDLMGSDRSHTELFDAVLEAADLYGSVSKFHVFTTLEVKNKLLSRVNNRPIHFHLSNEVIEMDEDPIKAVRQKKQATLVQGLKALKSNKIDVFITGGNTGALISCAALTLPKLPGIKRPALLATLPSLKGSVTLLDVGGNIQLKASLLYQYALIGIEHHRQLRGVENPTVGLLNVGVESKKGTIEHREAFQKLSQLPTFIGNVEPKDLFEGSVDVVVTDGFTGNVLLKTAEGVVSFIFNQLQLTVSTPLKKELVALSHRFEYVDYPGAQVIGIQGCVIKIHGSAGKEALIACLKALHKNKISINFLNRIVQR